MASEVYSYAIVLWELMTGDRPWHRDAEGRPYMDAHLINLVVNRKKRPELPGTGGASSASNLGTAIAAASPVRGQSVLHILVRRCWAHEPKRRPSFAHVVAQLSPQVARARSSSVVSSLTMAVPQHVDEPDVPLEAPDVFISFRFGEAHAEALALKAALEQRQLKVFLSDVSPGGNLQRVIAHALSSCRLAVVLATSTYGRQTNGLFCTCAEMNYIIGQRKPFYLVRMIPFDEVWAEPHTTMAFPPSIMQKLWLPGAPLPGDLVDEILTKLREQGGAAATPASAPAASGAPAALAQIVVEGFGNGIAASGTGKGAVRGRGVGGGCCEVQ